MKRSKLLYLSWVLAIVMLAAIITTYKNKSTTFYGIAETREIIINSENAVEIKKIHVMPGQAVKRAGLLVELARPELTMEINSISHQVDELRAQDSLDRHKMRTRIRVLKAEKASKISEINFRIRQLEAQYAMNRDLTSDLKSLAQTDEDHVTGVNPNPIEIEIENLQTALALSVEPIQIEVNMLEQTLKSTENPLKIQVESLEKELFLLLEEKNKLFIFAQVSGMIGSVNVKEREQIAPFSPILTLHTKTPSTIRGFIHEKTYSRVSVGQKTRVVSLADPDNSIIGEVTGVGSRIVEYPRRLKEMLAIPVWGREVLIRIHKDNRFLLGEKVLISLCDPCEEDQSIAGGLLPRSLSAGTTYATDIKNDPYVPGEAFTPTDIQIARSLRDVSSVEASGVIYLNDLKKYLLISDDTPGKRPVLYLMNREGTIEDQLIIRGLGKINDMEAITQDKDGRIYIACSQSWNKNGRLPTERKLLLRINRDRVLLTLDSQIQLYDLLKDAATRYPAGPLSIIAPAGPDNLSIDIEGMFFRGGDMYLGFKQPLKEDKAVVLRLIDMEGVFEKNRLNEESVQLWEMLDLRDPESGGPAGISDLYLHEDRVFVLSYAPAEPGSIERGSGNLWAYDLKKRSLSHMMRFEHLKPEGITFDPDQREYLVTFDHGRNRPSQFLKLKGL